MMQNKLIFSDNTYIQNIVHIQNSERTCWDIESRIICKQGWDGQ